MARKRRWNLRVIAMVVLTALTIALFATLVPIHISLYQDPPAFVFLAGAMLCAGPLLAIIRPRLATALFCVAAFALPLPVVGREAQWPWPWSVPALLTLVVFVVVLALLHGWGISLTAWLISIGSTLLAVLLLPDAVPAASAIANLVVVTSVSGGVLLIAILVASRLRVGAELSREREHTALEQSRRLLVEERTRIARELHDVVAHSMSLIQVQASTARYRVPGLAPDAAAEFDDIASTARASLVEMRRLLGVLRTEDQSAELAPQYGLGDIPTLVDSARRAGAEVSLYMPERLPADIPAGAHIAGYRITQEALSNAMRHAADTPVAVSVHCDRSEVRIRVQNARSSAAAPEHTPRGHGVRGMQERAALLGGSLDAGPSPEGGWTVAAVLPFASDSPQEIK